MFSSRRGHIHKVKTLCSEENPEAMVYLYQLCYVTLKNQADHLRLDDPTMALYSAVEEFYLKNKGHYPENDHFITQTEEKALERLKKGRRVLSEDLSFYNYLIENAVPSIRSNIWGRRWSLISAIIVLLAFFGMVLAECNK